MAPSNDEIRTEVKALNGALDRFEAKFLKLSVEVSALLERLNARLRVR